MDLLNKDTHLQTKTNNIPAEVLLTKTCFQFNWKFLMQTDGIAIGGPASSVTSEIYRQAHKSTALTTTSNPPKNTGTIRRCVTYIQEIITNRLLQKLQRFT